MIFCILADDLQDTLAIMRERAYEASTALTAFVCVSKGHTALTSECGSMLEEVQGLSIINEEIFFLLQYSFLLCLMLVMSTGMLFFIHDWCLCALCIRGQSFSFQT